MATENSNGHIDPNRENASLSLKLICTALLLGLVFVGLFVGVASARQRSAVVVDAQCPGPGNGFITSDGNGRDAQTFSARHSGPLVRARVTVNKPVGTTGDYILKITAVDGSGVPTNNTLAGTVVPDSTVPGGQSEITGTFGSPARVVDGQQYALVVARPNSTSLQVAVNTNNPCSGKAFSSNTQTGSFSEQSGTSGPGTVDLVFSTFVKR